MLAETTLEPIEGFLAVHGLRFHYLEWGDATKPPLVMLHGFSSSARGTWDQTAPVFSERWHVIALDHRGHGETDWDPEARYTLSTYVRDFAAVVRHFALAPFLLIGHSMGGAISLTYAAKHPELVRKLVLVDSGARTPGAPRPVGTFGERPLRFPSRAEAEAFARARMPEEDRNRKLGYGFVEHPDGTVGWRADVAGLQRARSAPPEPLWESGLWPELEALTRPTLVLRAGKSPSITPENAKRMAEANPLVRVIDYDEARHWLHQDEAERFATDVTRFFDEA